MLSPSSSSVDVSYENAALNCRTGKCIMDPNSLHPEMTDACFERVLGDVLAHPLTRRIEHLRGVIITRGGEGDRNFLK